MGDFKLTFNYSGNGGYIGKFLQIIYVTSMISVFLVYLTAELLDICKEYAAAFGHLYS